MIINHWVTYSLCIVSEKQKHFQMIAENLERTQFENISFCKNFILSNKQWLRNNITKILNKEAKKTYRDIILEQMEMIDGRLKSKRNLTKQLLMRKLRGVKQEAFLDDHEKKENKDIKLKLKKQIRNNLISKERNIYKDEKSYQSDEVSEQYGYSDAGDDETLLREGREEYAQVTAQVKPNRPTQIPISTRIILRYWLYRSRNSKKALSLIGGVIDRNVKKRCEFCGQSWGLLCLAEKNPEDIFLQYLHKIGQKNIYSDKQKDIWQDYFQQNCPLRTECLKCNEIMSDQFSKQDKVIFCERSVKNYFYFAFIRNHQAMKKKAEDFNIKINRPFGTTPNLLLFREKQMEQHESELGSMTSKSKTVFISEQRQKKTYRKVSSSQQILPQHPSDFEENDSFELKYKQESREEDYGISNNLKVMPSNITRVQRQKTPSISQWEVSNLDADNSKQRIKKSKIMNIRPKTAIFSLRSESNHLLKSERNDQSPIFDKHCFSQSDLYLNPVSQNLESQFRIAELSEFSHNEENLRDKSDLEEQRIIPPSIRKVLGEFDEKDCNLSNRSINPQSDQQDVLFNMSQYNQLKSFDADNRADPSLFIHFRDMDYSFSHNEETINQNSQQFLKFQETKSNKDQQIVHKKLTNLCRIWKRHAQQRMRIQSQIMNL